MTILTGPLVPYSDIFPSWEIYPGMSFPIVQIPDPALKKKKRYYQRGRRRTIR